MMKLNWSSLWRIRRSSSANLGLELTDRHLKLCELKMDASKVRAMHCARVELPAGTMRDGRVMNQEALERALGELLFSHPWSSRLVHFAIPSQMVMMKTLKLPDLPNKQLEKRLHYEMKQSLSFPFEEPHYDYYRIGTVVADEEAAAIEVGLDHAATPPAKLCEVAVIAAPRALLEQYVGILTRAGLQPASFEVKSFSLARLSSRGLSGGSDAASCILMDVNADNCELTLLDEGVIRMTRNVAIQFERLRTKAQGGIFEAVNLMDDTCHFDNACQAVIAELERLLNFCCDKLNHRNRKFERLVLTGSLERMDKLREALSSRMSRKVVEAGWDSLKVSGDEAVVDVSAYAVSIGLALRGRSV
ncbi:hypothetical protein PCCS19_26040 [Paenibacillus sp. CCS19]|uniref:type IV pilus biogenesis protein PilM n=1 Tax=Paenibacillus sp. CCS19 TaxID=3158387 RepID=UPI00256B6A88|nr:pilus assembly protein PilM [Paenibacillus cellulosilyticus]GMK39550.1 hypothetical protein PCCS19_26040 [Paenibacillus cellulosilyticus]